jgi:hypothetical protein
VCRSVQRAGKGTANLHTAADHTRHAPQVVRSSGRQVVKAAPVECVSKGVIVQPSEAQARAAIAAALIVRGVVEVPLVPQAGQPPNNAGQRLRELTDYVYRLVTMESPDR